MKNKGIFQYLLQFFLKFFDDIPPLVTIKEAMDIVKKYSSEDSVTFVNGILGAYKTKLEK